MYERFTDRARKAMSNANQEAHRFNHEYIGTEHIILGVIKAGGCGQTLFGVVGIDPAAVAAAVTKVIQCGPECITIGKLPQTPRAKKVIEYAMEEARTLHHNYVGTEHLLLGLAREDEGVAGVVLKQMGATFERLKSELVTLLGDSKAPPDDPVGLVTLEAPGVGSHAATPAQWIEWKRQAEAYETLCRELAKHVKAD